MKEYSKEEKQKIIEALKTIQQVCANAEDCDNCPLGRVPRDCMLNLTYDSPADWVINENDTWRALK